MLNRNEEQLVHERRRDASTNLEQERELELMTFAKEFGFYFDTPLKRR